MQPAHTKTSQRDKRDRSPGKITNGTRVPQRHNCRTYSVLIFPGPCDAFTYRYIYAYTYTCTPGNHALLLSKRRYSHEQRFGSLWTPGQQYLHLYFYVYMYIYTYTYRSVVNSAYIYALLYIYIPVSTSVLLFIYIYTCMYLYTHMEA